MKKVTDDRREVISQPQHAVKAEKDVYVKMRDGVHLASVVTICRWGER